MAQLDPYLHFDGNCAEAMRFYEKLLGGTLEALARFGESPQGKDASPAQQAKVMHASLRLGDRTLMGSDDLSGTPYAGMKGFSLSLLYASTDEARKVFAALAEGGTIVLPLERTFWAELFGMVRDRFGTPWMIGGGHR